VVMSAASVVVRPGVLALADQVVVSGCNFLTALFLARTLDSDAFGHYTLAFLVCLFLSGLHRAVFTQPMAVLQDRDRPWLQLARARALLEAHWVAIPVAGLLVAACGLFLYADVCLIAAAILFLACLFLQETARRFFYACGAHQLALWNDVISYAGQLLLLLPLAALGYLSPASAFLAMAASSLLAFVLALRRIERAHPEPGVDLSVTEVIEEQWPLSKWLLATVLAIWGAGQLYPFLLAPLGAVAVATFSVCLNLLNLLGLVTQSVANCVPGSAAAILQRHGKAAFRRDLLRTSLLAGCAGGVFVVAVGWLSEPVLHLLYGGRYDSAANILRTLSIGAACSLMGTVFGAYALALRDSRSGLFSNLGATVMTFTVGLWLIGEHAMQGAALGTSLSLATAMTLQAGFVLHRLRRMDA
jgi:O-antigen/teichoic acid export membrane protein